jgi:hypothetical protein
MDGRELTALRTKLRALNMEYSGLVRGRNGDGTVLRMEELREERRALMVLIAQQLHRPIVPSGAALSLVGSEIEATATAGAGAASVEVPRAPSADVLPLVAG